MCQLRNSASRKDIYRDDSGEKSDLNAKLPTCHLSTAIEQLPILPTFVPRFIKQPDVTRPSELHSAVSLVLKTVECSRKSSWVNGDLFCLFQTVHKL